MQSFLNQSIKAVIRDYPEVGQILDEFEIGCAPCSVGDCLLKDIVEIHNLSPEDERLLMARIAGVISPGEKIELPAVERKKPAGPKELKYSPPVKKLVEEHKLIKRCLALIPRLLEYLDLQSEADRELVLGAVDFIRNYADRFHHAKEEDILFKYFDENLDILKVMHQEHETGRAHVRAVLAGVEERDSGVVREHLDAYRELLKEHIKKEDEILYPWMDRSFSTSQVGELYSRFGEVDRQFGEAPQKYGAFIQGLEERFCGGRIAG
ncbi:MAG: hypothetical protein A3F83_03825 [Candidatus Glassbacteria bacterium RIFCSPLOWO2_12_FULL_58_11]|uniref:Hemerythrin-like domain-containing protein n=1 Tax=Candidatus Glassbacteria bacterium RIFCSPLOWO2_12_FULL_58_11 TaxID=1817867 RepID=A0A1F5YKI8_9BACT|nr:MAG: hypothetical protein A3F83_03825 [Candidatus Glassbacteria bacterium RIFCSPLOWO2_12_FULL_58_11]